MDPPDMEDNLSSLGVQYAPSGANWKNKGDKITKDSGLSLQGPYPTPTSILLETTRSGTRLAKAWIPH